MSSRIVHIGSLVAIVALSAPAAAQPCEPLPAGAIAWWQGEGDGDDAVCAFDGTPANGTSYAPGAVGQAFLLDGVDDHVIIPDSPVFAPSTNAITVEAWISRSTTGTADAVISKYDDDGAREWVLHVLDDATLRWAVYNDLTNEFRAVDTAPGVIPGVLTHVAATFDVATQDLRTYVNGAEVANTLIVGDTISSLADTVSAVRIGAYICGGNICAPFAGRIDEPAVYDRALMPSEIAAIHAAGAAGKCLEDRVYNMTQDTWYHSISGAVAAAVNGDEIVALPGIYCDTIDFQGKAITVRSADPADPEVVGTTLIDAASLGMSVVRCVSGEGPDTVLDGLTIRSAVVTGPGGGMLIADSSPTVSRCNFGNHEAAAGGAMHLSNSAATVWGCSFGVNFALAEGGAIAITDSSNPLIVDCLFQGNHAALGGALYLDTSTATISGCQFIGNSAKRGGAIQCDDSDIDIVDCTFDDNRCDIVGGAVYTRTVDLGGPFVAMVTGSTFLRNSSHNRGGALSASSVQYVITDCEFQGNYADKGAAVDALGFTPLPTTLRDCRFFMNVPAPGGGCGAGSGTVHFQSSGNGQVSGIVEQCVFSGNQNVALVADGEVGVDVENSTFVGHRSGGAVLVNIAHVYLMNCIVWDEYVPEFEEACEGRVFFGYSCIYGLGGQSGSLGGVNIDSDPLFVDADGADDVLGTPDDDLRLTAESPCIDAGIEEVDPDNPETDLGGLPRHIGPIDAGVHEFPIDCDDNGVADYLEIEQGIGDDCNQNLAFDACESKIDCNDNGVMDECDIADGLLGDANGNGLPDACEWFGEIAGNVVWDGDDALVTEDIVITGSVTVDAGVEVLVAPGASIKVLNGGSFVVNGTEEDPVPFSSTFLSGGAWDGIRYELGSSGALSHAVIERTLTYGVRIEDAAVSVEGCVIREVTGVDQQPVGGPGGPAYGIYAIGDIAPMIVGNRVEDVRGGRGGGGLSGSYGINGPNGADGLNAGEAGGTGADAVSSGGDGTDGSVGGEAVGIYCGPGTTATVLSNVVAHVRGGGGGGGGPGGSGGWGGIGGWGGHFKIWPLAEFGLFGGQGGQGGQGADGGNGAAGAPGGHAVGIQLDGVVTGQVHQNLLTDITGGAGGSGGWGGRGGSAGSGGWGGIGANIKKLAEVIQGSPGDGGDGGNAGNGGAGGAGAFGGAAYGIEIGTAATVFLDVAQNAVARLHNGEPGDGGSAGEAGLGGLAGFGGGQFAEYCSWFPCPDGGKCYFPHDGPGCDDDFCCNSVCSLLPDCCESDWDGVCAGLAPYVCVVNQAGWFILSSQSSNGAPGAAGVDGFDGFPGGLPGSIVGLAAAGAVQLTVTNTILESASADESTGVVVSGSASLLVRDSTLFGFGTPFGPNADQGSGTLFVDPMFVDPDAGDFHLMAASPCIDTGDNGAVPAGLETDLDGNVRIIDGDDDDVADVDMGVYELGGGVTCDADVTGDGAVDVQDLVEVILAWGCMDPPGPCPADLTGDGFVDVQDLVAIILAWGPCP